MEVATIESQTVAAAKTQKFAINLTLIDGQTPKVRSCEVTSGLFRSRTSFVEAMDIDSIFVESIAAAVKECLSSIKMKNQVVSLPTFAVETPHLVLAKAHIMSSMRSNGESSIILRFNVFLGSHGAAFRPEIGVDRGIVGQVDHVSAAVLCEIAMPLLNLCLSQEIRATDDPAAMQAFLDRLAVESHEIQFQVELIKRFVEQAGQADKAPALPRPAMNLIP